MRKDTIEARIVGIERDMKEMRSDIRQELRSMIAELKEFQALMIEDRIGEVQETTAREYCQIAYDNAIVQARGVFRARMVSCPPGPARDECYDHLVEQHLRPGIAELDSARPDDVPKIIDRIRGQDAEERKSDAGTPCETCMLVYDAERDRLLAMGEKFVRYRESLSRSRESVYIRQIPDDVAVSDIVEPLSHKARFAMLKCLTPGRKSYKELGEVTGYTGGHLLYHLNRLIDAGLVAKEEDSGLYRLTEKGLGIMEIVRKMYAT